MITPTKTDIGRAVTYDPGYPSANKERGRISALSARAGFVFVRYGVENTSKLTPIDKLEWS